MLTSSGKAYAQFVYVDPIENGLEVIFSVIYLTIFCETL